MDEFLVFSEKKKVQVQEKQLYNYLKLNITWLCPNDNYKCWLHKFLKEFKQIFQLKWMSCFKRKIFLQKISKRK